MKGIGRRILFQWLGVMMAGLLCAAPGFAQTTLVTCPGTATNHYTPGLTDSPQLIAVNANATLGPCVGDATVVSATYHFGGQGTLSCALTLNSVSGGTTTVTWQDGQQSTATFVRAVTERLPIGDVVTTNELLVTAGRYAGANMTFVATLVQPNLLACMTPPGVTDAAGPAVMTITSLQ
ncbi:hypothetical protein [Andreprevotia chitinilytica]|uniref:hypothetical protein n=1 Tax=Andreprevotia chitinilytica TaxID=396808 RepID=UPI000551566A|nr:hypothetical protein [Andreprevotia chitinilytica]